MALKEHLREAFSCLSRFFNVLNGGTADISYSARAYRDNLRSRKVIDRVFYLLFREENHCQNWWNTEVARSISVIEAEQRRMLTVKEALLNSKEEHDVFSDPNHGGGPRRA